MKKLIKENMICLVVYLILTIVYFYPILASTIFKNPGSNIISGDDLLGVSVYDRLLIIKAFKEFVIPWWNPYIHNGFTFHSISCIQFFYPFTFLHLVMPILSAFTVNYMVHVFLAGAGTFFFIKSLGISYVSAFVSGLIFMFCSFLPSNIYNGHFVQLDTFIWVPWYFYAFEKAMNSHSKEFYRFIIFGSVFIALALLAGHWQFVFMGVGALSFYALFNVIWFWTDGQKPGYCIKPAGILFSFIIGGVMLAAVQVIPTLIDMNFTIRSAKEATYDVVSGYPFRIMDIITFIAPLFSNKIHWEDAGYTGILPLFLAFYALIICTAGKTRRKIIFFLCLAIFALFLSFGNQSPFYAIHYFFKPLRTFRVPARFITIWMFSLSVLAGIGFNNLIKLDESGNRKKTFIYAFLMGMFFILAIFSAGIYQNNENLMQTRYFPVIFITISMLIIMFYTIFRRFCKVLICFSILFIVVDLFLYKSNPLASGHSYIGSFDMTERLNNDTWWLKPIKDVITKEKDVYPYARVNWSEQPILNMQYYPLTINKNFLYDGPWNCPLTRVYDVQELAVSSGGPHSSIYDLFGVRYVWSKEELDKKESSKYQKSAENIYINTKALPRAFMVYKYQVLKDKEVIFQEMGKSDFIPDKLAILEEDPGFELPDKDIEDEDKVNIIKYDFNNIILDVKTENPGILVLTDAYHPGWKVYIDSKRTEIFPVDWAVRGVYIPKGRHNVNFYFFPWYYKTGIAISVICLFMFVIILIKITL